MDGRQAPARRRGFARSVEAFSAFLAFTSGEQDGSGHAAEHDSGVPAFNINNMEQALAIMDAASTVDAPVIIQASRGARAYANDVMLRHMMDAVTEIYPQIPVCVHLDHGQ